jgi:ABC-type multidrug transport system permease subunit
MFKKNTISDILIISAAFASLIYSMVAFFTGDKDTSSFVGMWVPALLGFGIYLNILKQKKNG